MCKNNPKKNGFDINFRTDYTMRTLGHGYSGIKKFTQLMNMPKPMTQRKLGQNYWKIVHCSQRSCSSNNVRC